MADYISREAAIERFCNVYCGCSPEECGFKIPQDGAEECAAVRALKETPAADVRPVVRGKWKHDGSDWKNRFICDQCGYKWFFNAEEAHFCPNCGADMRGGGQ